VPLTVNFTDLSTGSIDSWNWDFGDGSTSTQQNPSHTYDTDGTYTVSLTISGPAGSDTETKRDYITASHRTCYVCGMAVASVDDQTLELVEQVGFDWVLYYASWALAEPVQGQYDWAWLDRAVAQCEK